MLLVTKQLPAIDFYSIFLTVSYTVEVNDNCLVTNIFHNIFFYVQRKKESHTGLEQIEDEQITDFLFWVKSP